MDSTIFHLFGVDEIFERFARRRMTGCFHIYTANESANVFFKDGFIVAASQGPTDGEQVLKQVLEWNTVHYLWQPNAAPTQGSLKPLKIVVPEFLAHWQASARCEKVAAVAGGAPPTPPSTPVIMIPAKGQSTGPLVQVTSTRPRAADLDSSLTATKPFALTAEVRATQEEALLTKHKLALASVDNPGTRMKISRVSSLVGRNQACDLTISHTSISRQHCLLQLTDRGLHVKDLDTTNGTRVNGIPLKEGYVSVGDKLTIGHLHFILEKA